MACNHVDVVKDSDTRRSVMCLGRMTCRDKSVLLSCPTNTHTFETHVLPCTEIAHLQNHVLVRECVLVRKCIYLVLIGFDNILMARGFVFTWTVGESQC